MLNPMLFNIFVLPLSDVVESCGLTYFSYADDTQIIFSLSFAQDHEPSDLNLGLSHITFWMNNNSLKLNGDKMEVIILGMNPQLWGLQHWPEALGTLSDLLPKVKNLGFVLDENLSINLQMIKVTATCFAVLTWLKKLIWLIPQSAQRTVVQALILSRLDYGNLLYLEIDQASIRRL